jgi:hypothetical protein
LTRDNGRGRHRRIYGQIGAGISGLRREAPFTFLCEHLDLGFPRLQRRSKLPLNAYR